MVLLYNRAQLDNILHCSVFVTIGIVWLEDLASIAEHIFNRGQDSNSLIHGPVHTAIMMQNGSN